MAYIINAVAIPRIEYESHLTVFSELEVTKLITNLRKLLRYKIGLSNTAPNVILSRKEVYNLIDFYDRQSEVYISNLIFKVRFADFEKMFLAPLG